MNKNRFGKIINLIVLMMIGIFLFNACSLLNWPERLETPTLTLEGTVVKWNNVEGATIYSLYDDDTKIADVEAQEGEYTSHNFISNINKKVSKHYFTVIARGDNYFDSERSNKVTYIYTPTEDRDDQVDTSLEIIDNSGIKAPKNVKVNDGQLVWDAISGVSEYYVCFYTSCSDNVTIKVNGNSVHMSNLFGSSEKDIISIRVGAKIDGVINYGETVLYNREDHGDYSEVFVFGNVLGDYYIEGMDELSEICYFAFINRLDELNVEFAPQFTGSTNINSIQAALRNVFSNTNGAFYETMAINYSITQAAGAAHKREYCFTFGYCTKAEGEESAYEPTITSSTTYVKENPNMYPYYKNNLEVNNAKWTARSSSYNNFASDRRERIIEVKTSEQLYWAIENGFTPTFPADATEENCTALRLYNKAKNILREIICDGMTKYEKVRCIFDWICVNTVYDYAETGRNADLKNGVAAIEGLNNSMRSTCYYLEGVLEKGLAVCDGYSKTFALLCNMEDIDCYRVVGTANGGGHAWNKVKIGDEWYMCDITWAEIYTYDNEAKKYVENLSHETFLVPDDTDHVEFQSEYTDAFRRNHSATKAYNHYSSTYINMDKLVQNLKLNDVIAFVFNGKSTVFTSAISNEIKTFIYDGKIPNMDNKREYADLLARTIEKVKVKYDGFEDYIIDLLGGVNYDSIKNEITVDDIVNFLNKKQSANIKTDYTSYYEDSNRDLVLKDVEDFEILTLYILYSGQNSIDMLLAQNNYVKRVFYSDDSTALQTEFNKIKSKNQIFNIEFTDILGYQFHSTSIYYAEVDNLNAEIVGIGMALIMEDKTAAA